MASDDLAGDGLRSTPTHIHLTFRQDASGDILIDKASPEPFVGSVEFVRIDDFVDLIASWSFNVMLECSARPEDDPYGEMVIGGDILKLTDLHRLLARLDGVEPLPLPFDLAFGQRWRPLDTAPYNTPVRIKAGNMTFIAELLPSASMNEDGECDQWQAVHEGEHPPCWSGGACWASNEDEDPSLQPKGWMPLPPSPEKGEG